MFARQLLSASFVVVSFGLNFVLATAAEVYYVQPIADLEILEGELPESRKNPRSMFRNWRRRQVVQPYAVLEGEGKIYVTSGSTARPRTRRNNQGDAAGVPTLAVQVSESREITGRLFLPKQDFSGMQSLKFTIPAKTGQEDQREAFLQTKLGYYTSLQQRDLSGNAWFRHQVRETREQLNLSTKVPEEQRNRFRRRESSMARTYSLISGGRAVSENLQLDRLLPQAKSESSTVALDSIQGITIQAFDWTSLNKGAKPLRDPLAKLIPEDQYAVFLPSFSAMVALADHAGEQGSLFLHAAETRTEDAGVRQRYEKQLGLGLSTLARKLGPALIKSVALTGADPYLRTGADLAILFEANDANTLRDFVFAQVTLTAGSRAGAKAIEGSISGVTYQGFRSADRSICTYVAAFDDAVVVTNSPVQLEQVIRVSQGKLPSLGSLEEYTFFRDRYPLGDSNETGLLILSDSTIRKWCGPRWRIATSRRTRAAALMAELQASHLDRLVEGKVETGPLHTDFAVPDAGDFTLRPGGVQSSVYGTLEFLTPILELDLKQVTQAEADFYERWREGYERYWSNFFDPIAIQFHASSERLGVDLTVMPLIDFSDYRWLADISQGAVLGELSGDPHDESLVHAVLALNTDSAVLNQGASMATALANVNPLSWMGQSVALYVDDDPLWAECAKIQDEKKFQEFLKANVSRLPIAANIEVKSSFKLIAFLAGIRTFIEQSAPGMTAWETLSHQDQPYVKVSPSVRARSGNPWDEMAIYYVASGKSLVVSISEDVLKRAIDRQIARSKNIEAGEPVSHTGSKWLGENLGVTLDGRLQELLHQGFGKVYHQRMQRRSWGNLAILNEWHGRYAGQDPVAVHQQVWQRKLICPGGGEYRWNESWQTMESTVYGHPGEPKFGTSLPTLLQTITSANFGQTFEENGLRARVELTREAQAKSPR